MQFHGAGLTYMNCQVISGMEIMIYPIHHTAVFLQRLIFIYLKQHTATNRAQSDLVGQEVRGKHFGQGKPLWFSSWIKYYPAYSTFGIQTHNLPVSQLVASA